MFFWRITAAAAIVGSVVAATPQWFPLNRKGEVPEIQPYTLGLDLLIDCISRNIDTGEHNFDSNGRIVYTAFPTCKETGKPLAFAYGVSEDVNCTITFLDEMYHMFQLYVHEDAPFSCRIPFSTEAHYLESGGAYVPLTFNLRGEVHDAHMDIDPVMNAIFVTPELEPGAVVSAVAWSSGTNATRVVIGDLLTLQVAARWELLKPTGSQAGNLHSLPYSDGFYRLPVHSIPLSFHQFYFVLALVAGAAFIVGSVYRRLGKKPRYPNFDREADIVKTD